MTAAELRTSRLLLRRWRDEDLDPFAALNADPAVMEHYPKTLSRDESDASALRIRRGLETRPFGLWAVEVINGAPFAGYVGLGEPNFAAPFSLSVEIGWRLAHEHWGRGYATEAAMAVVDHAFSSLDLDGLVSFTAPANSRSRRVMERLGMSHSPEDDFDHPGLPDGHCLKRHVLYRLSRAAWTERRGGL